MSVLVRPMAGAGVVARSGDLLLVCGDSGDGPDELLTVLADVARAGGDGASLVRRVAALLATDSDERFPACALSGPAGDRRLAVLVYGAAVAEVATEHGTVTLSGVDAITSVDQLVSGTVQRVSLSLPGAGEPDRRARLDGGVITGAGLVYTTGSSTMDIPAPRSAEPVFAAEPAAPEPPAHEPPAHEPTAPEPAAPEPEAAPAWTRPTPPPGLAVPVFTGMTAAAAPAPVEAAPAEAEPEAEDHNAVAPLPVRPFTMFPPDESLIPPPPPAPSAWSADGERWRTPSGGWSNTPVAETQVAEADAEDAADNHPEEDAALPDEPAEVEAAHVLGVFCPQGHFIDPRNPYCPVCGISLAQQTVVAQEGPRPSLGSLHLDDGETVELASDFVIGRDPRHDPDVAAGQAQPLKLLDSEGVVSRRHARVALVGWDVQIIDLGSSNGTYVQPAGAMERQQLTPHVPAVIRPGTVVTMGRRWLRFEPPRQG